MTFKQDGGVEAKGITPQTWLGEKAMIIPVVIDQHGKLKILTDEGSHIQQDHR